MRVVTLVSLGASAVLGLAALYVAKTVLPNAATAKNSAVAPPPITGVPVVVARGDLKFGDRLDAGKLMILHLPPNAVPQGAFATVAQVLAQDNGGAPVALTPIAARQLLLPSQLSGPGARASVAAEIADGMRAYTIKVSDVTGVGGHALPGDHVDVVLMHDLTPDGSTRNFVSEVVIQDVRVLGVDLNADLVSNKPATPSTATLEVSVAQAQKLAVAGDLGKLSLALRKTGAAEVASAGPMRTANFALVGSARASGTTSTGPAVRRSEPGFSGPGLIVIVEGGGHGRGPSRAREPAPAAPEAPAAAPPAAPGTTPVPNTTGGPAVRPA
jgi:pilus assembly protein CpaB